MKICHALATLTLGLTATSALHATTFSLPQGNDDLVGKPRLATVLPKLKEFPVSIFHRQRLT